MSVTELAGLVNALADTARRGGRCTVVDDTRCILYDCSNWNTAMHNDVLARFHTCSMTVSPLESSVSGFIVIFDLSSPPQRMRTAFLVLCATAALCTATWHLARALAPDVDLWPPFLNLSAPFLNPAV